MNDTIDVAMRRKRNLLVALIRSREGACKATLKEWSGLSMESVIRYTDELVREGFVRTAGYSPPSVGRKAAYLAICPEGGYFLGLRFTPAEMSGVVLDFAGNPLFSDEDSFPDKVDAYEILERLCACAGRLAEKMGERRDKLLGIGVAVPGLVDRENGIGIRYVNVPGWENIPVRTYLEERLGIPVTVEHSLKATALAAARLPENRDAQDLLFILVGRGVGMAILANGEIYPGSTNLSGEIGHIFAADNGIRCQCGRTGCLETVAGSPAVLQRLRSGLEKGEFPLLRRSVEAGRQLDIQLLIEAAAMGDSDAAAEISMAGNSVGTAISAAVTLLNPSKIIFSGAITAAPLFQKSVLEELHNRCFPESLKFLQLAFQPQNSEFDAKAAASLAYERCFGLSPDERRELSRFGPVGII